MTAVAATRQAPGRAVAGAIHLRAEAARSRGERLWCQYSAPNDLTKKQAISAERRVRSRSARAAGPANLRIRLSSSARRQDEPARRARRLPPTMCLGNAEQNLVPPAASQQDALRREDLLVHIAGHADTAIALSAHPRHGALSSQQSASVGS